ncbi:hypothetical protein DEJ49_07925 [Streptomyces venezuelae]|uniref:Uncharacterized protein n=1 Tax=Streptomyces venezuelae TaxID=54571 RepID=A0A5P2CVP2_STRVZ|nr:hypothetical protein DEJ49_07925 [Streptomyces venezuelae]
MNESRTPGRASGRAPGNGERFLLSLALVAVGLLWMTRELAQWAVVLCVVAAVAGAAGMVFFGLRFMRERAQSQ